MSVILKALFFFLKTLSWALGTAHAMKAAVSTSQSCPVTEMIPTAAQAQDDHVRAHTQSPL